MSEETNQTSNKHLSAKELLSNKGICAKAWNKWDESSRALPKMGAKLFEPNGSWLQNKQIEKGLESRKYLLGIERVERRSQLASAEWLPEEKKARVTKKTGQEWVNYGLEVNANLYLIPEEALMLLETECLELTWDGIPLSVQQAYELLIDSEGSDCTLDEYRVYSQLTRLGYRLQRFCYNKSPLERSTRSEDTPHRKKVIINPENGLWMAGNNVESAQSSKNDAKTEIDKDVKETVDDIVTTVNGSNAEVPKIDDAKIERTIKRENDIADGKSSERRSKNMKLEIVSEQTILSPIKIVKDGTTAEQLVPKWPGARIQRNVKLLPKRNDIVALSPETLTPGKRRRSDPNADPPDGKKSKHEVIDLSDDEIEEIPRPMSRMEMLNCLPNVASTILVTETISRRYLPRGVRPQRSYRYDGRKTKKMQEKPGRTNPESPRNDNRTDSSRNNGENGSSAVSGKALIPFSRNHNPPNYSNNWYSGNGNRRTPYFSNNSNQYSSSSMMTRTPGGICMQQISVGPNGWQNSQSVFAGNRWASFQMNMFRNLSMMGFAMRGAFGQNHFGQHTQYSVTFAMQQQQQQQQQQRHQQQYFQFNRPHRYLDRNSFRPTYVPQYRPPSQARNFHSQRNVRDSHSNEKNRSQPRDDEIYQSAFAKLPGATSWPELKQKWRDAKTITIDDEETGNGEDANDVQVVERTIEPLIGPNGPRAVSKIFERLRIIKSAPEKIVRRRKSDFRISYNVYSSGNNFRKANPGLPMFHLVISSQKENDILQPVELNRLQQDGRGAPIMFARVSNASITFLQPGIVSLPNLM